LPGELPALNTGKPDTTRDASLQSATTIVSLEREADRERLSVDEPSGNASCRASSGHSSSATWRSWRHSECLPGSTNTTSSVITLAERMVTQQGIMTFLGATTVQVGAIAFVIAKYLFPHRPHDS
jgi:hypothetical protein